MNFESIAIDDRFSLPGRGPFFGMVKSGVSQNLNIQCGDTILYQKFLLIHLFFDKLHGLVIIILAMATRILDTQSDDSKTYMNNKKQ